MKNRTTFLIPLSFLALGAVVGCNKQANSTQILDAANATLAKVTTFSNVLGKENFEETDSVTKNATNAKSIEIKSASQKDYCEEQKFGFYIYNNIHYALKYLYGSGDVSLGTVISGTTETEQAPDLGIRNLYVYHTDLPKAKLSAKATGSSKGNTTTVEFQADWDFSSDKMQSILPYMNCAILTNGKIVYNTSTKETEKLMINYYFTNLHRSFGSFTMDFKNNKFYYLDGGGVDSEDGENYHTDRWDKQSGGKDATIHTNWNDGSLTPDILRNYKYYVYGAYAGNITDDLSKLEMEGYDRTQDYANIDITNETGEIEKWNNKVKECYSVNKELKLRKDMLDTSNVKAVEMNNCAKYAQARTKLYWVYDKQGTDARYLDKSFTPFREKNELANDLDAVIKLLEQQGNKVNDKLELAKSAKTYISSVEDKNYFGDLSDMVGFDYSYVATDAKDSYRFNCFKVVTDTFSYKLTKHDNASVSVSYRFNSSGNIELVN